MTTDSSNHTQVDDEPASTEVPHQAVPAPTPTTFGYLVVLPDVHGDVHRDRLPEAFAAIGREEDVAKLSGRNPFWAFDTVFPLGNFPWRSGGVSSEDEGTPTDEAVTAAEDEGTPIDDEIDVVDLFVKRVKQRRRRAIRELVHRRVTFRNGDDTSGATETPKTVASVWLDARSDSEPTLTVHRDDVALAALPLTEQDDIEADLTALSDRFQEARQLISTFSIRRVLKDFLREVGAIPLDDYRNNVLFLPASAYRHADAAQRFLELLSVELTQENAFAIEPLTRQGGMAGVVRKAVNDFVSEGLNEVQTKTTKWTKRAAKAQADADTNGVFVDDEDQITELRDGVDLMYRLLDVYREFFSDSDHQRYLADLDHERAALAPPESGQPELEPVAANA